MNTSFFRAATALALVGVQVATPAFAAAQCTATSGATVPVVVELYTSEGCDSCPPADRWLSKTITVAARTRHVDVVDWINIERSGVIEW